MNNDDWQKLAEYPTNLLAETHASYLSNNGIKVSVQGLSGLPGLNSGGVLWVAPEDFEQAKVLLDNIEQNLDDNFMTESSHLDDNDQPDVQG
jgi:hypothetical protein